MDFETSASSIGSGNAIQFHPFPETLRKQVRDLHEHIQTNAPINNTILYTVAKSAWEQASLGGYPTAAKLCRGLIGIASSSSVEQQDGQAVLLAEALEALVHLLHDPTNLRVIAEADRIALALEELQRELTVEWYPSEQVSLPTPKQASHTFPDSASADHTDHSIYDNDAISGLERCSHEETWIVSQVAAAAEDLASAPPDVRPAHQLMRILSGHSFFQSVDRVCIVGLVPDANQLVVVDSCIHSRMRDQGVRNRMLRGYSCLVNPQGSLARMQPGVLRIFGDSQAVLESFAKEGKPTQRSIAYVAESGLRSGICLAIGRGSCVQGFLFMNSQMPDRFRNVMRDYGPLLSLFSLLGTVSLDGAGFHATPNHQRSPQTVQNTAMVFNVAEFSNQLRSAMARLMPTECQAHVSQLDEHQFLYTPASVLDALCNVIFHLNMVAVAHSSDLSIDVAVKHGQVQFTVRCEDSLWHRVPAQWRQQRLDDLADTYRNRPMKFALSDRAVVVEIPYEPAIWNGDQISYSVAF